MDDLEMIPTKDLMRQLKVARGMLANHDSPDLRAQIAAAVAELASRAKLPVRFDIVHEFKVTVNDDWSQRFVVQRDRDNRLHLYRRVPSGHLGLGQCPFPSIENAVAWATNQVHANGPFPD